MRDFGNHPVDRTASESGSPNHKLRGSSHAPDSLIEQVHVNQTRIIMSSKVRRRLCQAGEMRDSRAFFIQSRRFLRSSARQMLTVSSVIRVLHSPLSMLTQSYLAWAVPVHIVSAVPAWLWLGETCP